MRRPALSRPVCVALHYLSPGGVRPDASLRPLLYYVQVLTPVTTASKLSLPGGSTPDRSFPEHVSRPCVLF